MSEDPEMGKSECCWGTDMNPEQTEDETKGSEAEKDCGAT